MKDRVTNGRLCVALMQSRNIKPAQDRSIGVPEKNSCPVEPVEMFSKMNQMNQTTRNFAWFKMIWIL